VRIVVECSQILSQHTSWHVLSDTQ